MDLEWVMNNLDLMAAVYTFIGQYKFYQAISIEALPGRDPELVDLQYYYRVGANLDYTIAALLKLISQYVNNLDVLLDAVTDETTVTTSSQTTTGTNTANLSTMPASNKAVDFLNSIPKSESITIRITRRGRGRYWQKAGWGRIIRDNPSENSQS